MPGYCQAFLPVHGGGLDEEDFSADARHGQPGSNAGHLSPFGDLRMELRTPQVVANVLTVDLNGGGQLSALDTGCGLAKQAPQLALEVADAGLTGVVDDDPAQRLIADGHLVRREAVAVELPPKQVIPRDGQFLLLGVAVEPDDLHPVEQRRRDGVGDIRRRDEQDFGKIQIDLEIVIPERVVLRWVQHFEQRRRGIAPPVAADLVDLVEHDHRVAGAGFLEGTGDPAREGANVGSPVSTDLSFIVDAAKRNSRELATQRPGNRLPKRRLANARWSDQRDDGTGAPAADHLEATRVAPLPHCEELDDSIFDVLESGMVLVEHPASLHNIELVDGPLVPWHVEHPIEVVPYPAGLRVLLAGPLEPVELALDFFSDRLGHAGIFDLLPVFGGNVTVALAEFFLDGLQLLAKQELALPLLHPFLYLVADLVLERGLGEDLAGPRD